MKMNFNLIFLSAITFLSREVVSDWTQIGSDLDGESADDWSGSAVAMSSDGSVIAVGAPHNDGNGYHSGHVRVYHNINNVWTQIGSDLDGESADSWSGQAVALSSDGTVIAVGAPYNDGNGSNSGHVRVYRNINNVWTQIGSDIYGESADDWSGWAVALSSDGTVIAVGAHFNDGNGSSSGHVRVYRNINNVWTQIGSDLDGESAVDNSGSAVAMSSDGSVIAIGAPLNDGNGDMSGHVRVYGNINNVWTQIGSDLGGESAGDGFGWAVALSSDGTVIAVGAYANDGNGSLSGHVRVYRNINNIWTQIGSDVNGESAGDSSGSAVALSSDGTVIAVGAPYNDGNGSNSGHVRIFKYIPYAPSTSPSMYPSRISSNVPTTILREKVSLIINIAMIFFKLL